LCSWKSSFNFFCKFCEKKGFEVGQIHELFTKLWTDAVNKLLSLP
jgi:hypothetical protein